MNTDHARRVLAFQDIKRVVPLTAVLERYGVLSELKRMGAQLYGRCEICGSASRKAFVVNPNSSEWKCFSPEHDAGGSTLEFVAQMEHCNIPTAAQLIARWFAIPSGASVQQPAQPRSNAMSGRPTMKAFVVEDKEEGSEEKPFWTRVGSAWPHGDGKGLNVQLATGVSVSGRLVLREYTDDDAKKDEEARPSGKFSNKKK